jgi:hypothetical protein
VAKDLKESLGKALEHGRRRRKKGHAPAPKPKQTKGGQIKRARDMAIDQAMRRADAQVVDLVVPREAQNHGNYRLVDFKIEEVIEGGKVKAKTAKAIRNLGGTPVERWFARGKIDDRQMAAIGFYQSAWRMHIGEPRVVANWSAVINRGAEGAIEIYAGTRIAAKESLRLLDQEVFFRLPVDHFAVWQNVVIWDEPAGVAGSRAGFCHKPAEAVAQLIVGTIASMIADIVIDSSRRDFGDLILDLDAPRRPGRGRAAR